MAGTADITVQDATSGQQSALKGTSNALWNIATSDYVVTLPALGAGNTNATVVAYGYQL